MEYTIRFYTIASVFIISVKLAVFVADDSRFSEFELLAPIEKKVGELIDEAVRFRAECEEFYTGVVEMAEAAAVFAVRAVVWSARSAIRAVSAWARFSTRGFDDVFSVYMGEGDNWKSQPGYELNTLSEQAFHFTN